MPRKQKPDHSPLTPLPEYRVHNEFFRTYVKEQKFETREREQELADALNVPIDDMAELMKRDDFVIEPALAHLRLIPRNEYRSLNQHVRDFVKNEMVDWERVEFAETLGITVDQLDDYIMRDDFLTDGALDYMRACSGLGLDIPEIPDHDVNLKRHRHDGTVDYIVEIVRRSDKVVVGIADEDSFDASVDELMMFDGLGEDEGALFTGGGQPH